MDAPDMMACSSALVSSSSSSNIDSGYAWINVQTNSMLGLSQVVSSRKSFSYNAPHEPQSHARTSGVLPSTSRTEHAAGCAYASNRTTDKFARLPTAM